jgi:hypothetical protein
MAICGCGLPVYGCQPAVAGSFIYADLWGELNTHLAPTGFVYSEFSCSQATARSFPLSKHTGGGDSVPGFSGLHVCLLFMWKVGLPPSPVEFSSHCHFLQPFPLLIAGCVLLLLLAGVFVYSSRGKWVFPPLLWSFPPSTTITSFPASGCWVCPCSHRRISSQARLVYLQFQEGFPFPPSELRVPHPLCHMSLLFLLLITQFLFFPQVGAGLSRGLC